MLQKFASPRNIRSGPILCVYFTNLDFCEVFGVGDFPSKIEKRSRAKNLTKADGLQRLNRQKLRVKHPQRPKGLGAL